VTESGDQDLSGFSMLDLFRTEVESQVSVLTEGLLALERNPGNTEPVEALMRAAHSIKGAARIVGVDPAVRVAHVMEDCFVAAQSGTVRLGGAETDVLLQGVDLLTQVSRVPEAEYPRWTADNQSNVEKLASAISAIVQTGGAPQPIGPAAAAPAQSALETAAGPAAASDAPPVEPTAAADRVLRVTAENLNRLMGLAGETLVASRWLEPFGDALLKLKNSQSEVAAELENFRTLLEGDTLNERADEHLAAAERHAARSRQLLAERLEDFELFARRSANLADRLNREVVASRMRPFADGVHGFPRMVRDLAKRLGKRVSLEIIGETTPVDRDILEKIESPLTHLLRNSIDHGIEPPEVRVAAGKPPEGTIRMEARHRAGVLAITLSDDGRGLDLERLKRKILERKLATPEMVERLSETEMMDFLFLPGFSTAETVTEISGRGVGLDAVHSMVHEVGGFVRASSQPGKGMTFHLQLPLTLSVLRTLLVDIAGDTYAFPLTRLDRTLLVSPSDIRSLENRQYVLFDGENVGLVPAAQVLELGESKPEGNELPVIVISDRAHRYGLVVDRLLGEHDLVVQPLDARLGKVPDISASALSDKGTPILIVDVDDLVRSIDNLLSGGRLRKVRRRGEEAAVKERKRILVIDDSITVREVERKLLENNGYEVEVAVDGMDGWNAVRASQYDLVITDVDMPRMNGIDLVVLIKRDQRLAALPVMIVSYKDRQEDRIRGLEAGANHYLTKSGFHDDTLMKAVNDLIGPA